jgi:hypothetical protein
MSFEYEDGYYRSRAYAYIERDRLLKEKRQSFKNDSRGRKQAIKFEFECFTHGAFNTANASMSILEKNILRIEGV